MIHLVLDLSTWFDHTLHLSDVVQSIDVNILAQEFKQTDIAGNVGKSWNHFVRTGQVWAFVLGAGLGYFVRTFTSFG
ncbi:hypothetical protein H6F51_07105 [Cyanobacteria bacterium FACHB-DQ100]|nr:hypothetical protein [Cyanobacteria bacterium FACHB-DQ100]